MNTILATFVLLAGMLINPFRFPPPAGGSTEFVTGVSAGSARNDYSDYIGCKITVGGAGVTVTHLGRWVISGNSGTHTVKITDGGGTTLGSVSVNTSGATPGTFVYTALGSPVALSASSAYYIASLESGGGDQWLDFTGTVCTTTAVASMDGGAYFPGPTFVGGGAGHSYGAVSFKY